MSVDDCSMPVAMNVTSGWARAYSRTAMPSSGQQRTDDDVRTAALDQMLNAEIVVERSPPGSHAFMNSTGRPPTGTLVTPS